jgi:hypothetical protein
MRRIKLPTRSQIVGAIAAISATGIGIYQLLDAQGYHVDPRIYAVLAILAYLARSPLAAAGGVKIDASDEAAGNDPENHG